MLRPAHAPRRRFARTSLALGALALSLLLTPGQAQQPRTTPVSVAEEDSRAALDGEIQSPEEIELRRNLASLPAFVDGFMASYLENEDIAGAVVTVVHGGETTFARGYGDADVEAQRPVDPESTLFRIGSISKLFVWTSVMQLADRGEVDLLTDVNAYLQDLEVPEAFGAPVTLADLMTHSAGFDESVIGLFARDAAALQPLGQLLDEELPARIRAPGDLISYSNHGTALAAYVVEQVTGEPWRSWVEREILQPLGLDSTSFSQPLGERLSDRLSQGYRHVEGAFEAGGFEYIPLAPAGAASSSATDMARLAQAYLNLGELEGSRILSEEAARTMQETLFRPAEGVNGMAHGFIELDLNGQRILGHGGDTDYFHSIFAFFPERDLGLFASFNTAGARSTDLFREVVEHLFPWQPDPAATSATVSLDSFTGWYRPTRYDHRTFTRLAALVSSFEIKAEDGVLVTTKPERREWLPIAPMQFRERDSSTRMVFREGNRRKTPYMFRDDVPVLGFERAPAWERPGFVRALVGIAYTVVIAALIVTFVAWIVRHIYLVRLEPAQRLPIWGRWAATASSLLLVGVAVVLAAALADPMSVTYGLSDTLETALRAPLLALALTAVALIGAIVAWLRSRATWGARLAFTVVVLAQITLLWQFWVWRLLALSPV